MSPDQFITLLGEHKASAILRTNNHERARHAMDAAVRGGFRIIEFTLSVPGAFELIEEFAARDDLVVGAGTVLTTREAEQAVEAGARFLVSPVLDEAVIACAHALGVAVMPGCATPTEMLRAHRAGAQLQKLFPEQGTGPGWIKQALGPLPFLKIVPTSGTSLQNAAEYLAAGAFALGFASSLFEKQDIAGERWDTIENRAAAMLAVVGGVQSCV